jgi:hypothetical protein
MVCARDLARGAPDWSKVAAEVWRRHPELAMRAAPWLWDQAVRRWAAPAIPGATCAAWSTPQGGEWSLFRQESSDPIITLTGTATPPHDYHPSGGMRLTIVHTGEGSSLAATLWAAWMRRTPLGTIPLERLAERLPGVLTQLTRRAAIGLGRPGRWWLLPAAARGPVLCPPNSTWVIHPRSTPGG